VDLDKFTQPFCDKKASLTKYDLILLCGEMRFFPMKLTESMDDADKRQKKLLHFIPKLPALIGADSQAQA